MRALLFSLALHTAFGLSSATCRDALRNDLDPPVSQCEPYATRCVAQSAQLCTESRRWREHTNCALVTPGAWVCARNAAEESVCMQDLDAGVSDVGR